RCPNRSREPRPFVQRRADHQRDGGFGAGEYEFGWGSIFMMRVCTTFLGMSLLFAGSAVAAPLLPQRQDVPSAMTENVKIVCEESGHCYRPPVRRPVARWVYGDGNFYGPYAGPGNYGDPRLRYRVLPFWWW